MSEIFIPSSLTIKQLFGNTDALYQIPRYQRPYSWVDEQLDKLWEDLREASGDDQTYFLGSVITARSEDSPNYLDVVDGQQRLITLSILFCVFRDLFPEVNKALSETDPFAVNIEVLTGALQLNNRFHRLRIQTREQHQNAFDRVVATGASLMQKRPLARDLKKDDPAYKLANTAWFFRQKLGECGETNAGLLLNFIFNKVNVIRIDCQSVSFAIKLFQVLNNRGLELSNSDLIKSFLIGRIQDLHNHNQAVKSRMENQFMDDWHACELLADEAELSLNEFFVMYQYYLLESPPRLALYDEFVKLLATRDPNQVIAEFKSFLNLYLDQIYNRNNQLIFSFQYLPASVYWKTLLLTAGMQSTAHYDEFAWKLRRFLYLNWIAGYTIAKIKQVTFSLIKSLKQAAKLNELSRITESHLLTNRTLEMARQKLGGELSDEPWAKAVFFLLEYQEQNPQDLRFISPDLKNIALETIVPKLYRENFNWFNAFTGQDISSRLETGANLTLVNAERNVLSQSEEFEKKVLRYSVKKAPSAKFASHDFAITRKIVDDYQSSKYGRKWNIQALNDRENWYRAGVKKIFDIYPEDKTN